MSQAEKKLFETGFVSNLIAKVESLKGSQDIVKQIFNSEAVRRQIETVLGKNRAAQLEARLLTERVMHQLYGAVHGNSSTGRQLYELAMAGAVNPYTLGGAAAGASGYLGGGLDVGDALTGALVFAARRGQLKVDERIAKRVGEMLASSDPAVLQRGMNIIARNENLRSFLRSFDLPAARVGAQQTTDAINAP
jgi:hypothetical protein